MSRLSRLSGLLAAAQLADRDIERERLRGERDSRNFATGTQALVGLANSIPGALDAYGKSVDDEALMKAKGLIADNASSVGTRLEGPSQLGHGPEYADKPEDIASTAAGGIEASKDFDPFGFKKRAAERARLAVKQGVTTNVQANRDKAKADELTGQKLSLAMNSADAKASAAEQKRADDQRKAAADEEIRREGLDLKKEELDIKRDAAKHKGAPKPPKPPPPPKFNDIDAVRREFNGLAPVKNFKDVSVSYEKMKQAAKNATPAGDLTLIYSFMKMQDPGSTVREGEFATAARAGSLPVQIQAAAEKLISGERLTPDQRADFMSQAQSFFEAQRWARDAEVARYSDLARKRGWDPADIVGSTAAPRPAAPAAGTPAPSPAVPLEQMSADDLAGLSEEQLRALAGGQ